jgi:hypothetical protein
LDKYIIFAMFDEMSRRGMVSHPSLEESEGWGTHTFVEGFSVGHPPSLHPGGLGFEDSQI